LGVGLGGAGCDRSTIPPLDLGCAGDLDCRPDYTCLDRQCVPRLEGPTPPGDAAPALPDAAPARPDGATDVGTADARVADAPAAPPADAPVDAPAVVADAARDQAAAGPDAAPDGAPAPPPDAACHGPIACAVPATGGDCDPVCQTGCGCGARCTYGVAQTTPSCQAATAPFLDTGAACDPRGDRCAPGALCLDESRLACGSHCYRLCRADADCGPRARCTVLLQLASGAAPLRACSPEAVDCDPTGAAACPRADRSAAFGCYVLSVAHPDLTTCDCAGVLGPGQECSFEHECRPGYECVRVGGVATCRALCKLPGGACPGGGTCGPLMGGGVASQKFGYCR
jgi:hypothetical protein